MNDPRFQKGAAAAIVLLSLLFLIPMAGLVINGGLAALTKIRLQNTADAVALSCVIANQKASGSCTSATSTSSPIVSNVNNNHYQVTLTVPVTCPGSNQGNCVRAVAANSMNTVLMGIAGLKVVNLQAGAISGTQGGYPCILSKNGNLAVSGGGSVAGPDCSVESNAGINLSGGSKINAAAIDYVSGSAPIGTTPAATRTSTMPDPFLGTPVPANPAYTCNSASCNACKSGSCTFSPGIYPSGITVQSGGKGTFLPGLYKITGGTFNLANNTSSASGSGVTFYLTGSAQLNFSGGINMSLSAPTAAQASSTGGVYGLLIWQDATDTSSSMISGGNNMVLAGNLYLPSSSLTLSGGSAAGVPFGSIVAHDITMSGASTMNFTGNYGPSGGRAYPVLLQ